MSLVKDDLSLVLSGEAGQGIQTVENILSRVLKLSNYNVFATKEYMSRIRGGNNTTQIRVSSKRVAAPLDRIDIIIPLNAGALERHKGRISAKTIILAESQNVDQSFKSNLIDVPFTRIAADIGNPVYSNVVAASVIAGTLGVDQAIFNDYLRKTFAGKSSEIVEGNIAAAGKGYAIASDLINSKKIEISVKKDPGVADQILITGTEAIALGAIAGGCNFIAAYPMTPSTGVFTFLSAHAREFGIISEQAEDEIAAMNMALGAWYAGARALVNTSGGGFDLMTEGLSLAGMLESPVVINLSQRPGPATGLPTRTEQGDLNLALYAGHGEFPRLVFAPGKMEDAFYLTQLAFNLADKYQVPAFILSDQHLVDTYYNIPEIDVTKFKNQKYIVRTDRNYKRYKITSDGVSPRGIPGYGDGLVILDSDEHDEEGHITEDLDLSTKMVDKRLKKLDSMTKEALPPELVGGENYKTLVIGWGSTYNAIVEAMGEMRVKDAAFLHFKQLNPLHPKTADYLKKAKKTVIVENNPTSQFGRHIKVNTGIEINEKILKYNGLPFSVEELKEKLGKVL